ncbi:sentrin-specific protease 7 isoform X2 [Rhinatrema bivittatum]|uniref:sentrin-specific protease 7 isoform X2 n=1 Tax=Rhinatrema bivittatum TaxID=194408 RepID=UPI0011271A9A|nr:sentrin-specific protease 7 isoform X2 [Rhinatrema bivittatum]
MMATMEERRKSLVSSDQNKVKATEEHFSPSYGTYNRTRSQESCTYRRSCNFGRLNGAEERATIWHEHQQKINAASSKRQMENLQGKGRKRAPYPLRSCHEEPKGNQESDAQQKGSKILNCTGPGSEEDNGLNSWSRKRRSSGSSSDQSSSSSHEKSTEQLKEPKICCSTLSPINRSSNRNRHCLRKQCQSLELQENRPQPPEKEQELTCHGNSMEPSVACTQKPNLDLFSKASNCKSSSTSSNSLRTSLRANMTDQLKTGQKLPNLRKLHIGPHCRKRSADSADPIVLSSDEEEGESHRCQNAEIVHLQTLQGDICDTEETAVTTKSSPSEQSPASIQEENEQSEILDDLFENNSHKTTAAQTEGRMLRNSPIEIEFVSIYVARMTGRSRGPVKFATECIEIPFQVDDGEDMSLLLDTHHLKGYGLWTNENYESPFEKQNSLIYFRLAKDYVEQMQTQLGHTDANRPSTFYEFVLLELSGVPTAQERHKLAKLIKAVSRRNRSPELCKVLSWEQAYPSMMGIPHENWACMIKCFALCSELQPKKGPLVDVQSLPQKSNVKDPKPNYTLVHKHSVDCYSVTISPKPDEAWSEVRSPGPGQKLIVYPPPPTKGGLGVTREDLECLEHGEFLNDVIIDFYLKYLLMEKVPKQLAERSHVFSSFFYRCLTRKEKNSTEEISDLSAAQKRHQRVKRWTRHVDIFKKDYIFVPVNEESHWYLAVICFPSLEKTVYEDRQSESPSTLQPRETRNPARKETVIVFHDSSSREEEKLDEDSNEKSEDDEQRTSLFSTNCENPKNALENNSRKLKVCKRPCILMLDSLRAGSLQNTVQMLREYLKVEWHVKKGTAREFSRSNMRDFCPRVPKQDNSSDCGIYLLQYVESFFQNPIIDFELPVSLEHWFPRHIMRTKREEIRDLILGLHVQQQSSSMC